MLQWFDSCVGHNEDFFVQVLLKPEMKKFVAE